MSVHTLLIEGRGDLPRHGGQVVSQYLREHLHDRFETVETSLVPNVVGWLKESGKSESPRGSN
jgi:hypothetical protein